MVSSKAQLVTLVASPVHHYMQGPQCTSKARLEGKTVVITGANTGIGKYTALDMSRSVSRREIKFILVLAGETKRISRFDSCHVKMLYSNLRDNLPVFETLLCPGAAPRW